MNHPEQQPVFPLLTTDVPGIGGRIKVHFEDFQVEEIPLYEPSGEGEHTYFGIEKRGLPTLRAIHEIARALRVAPQDIGYAGLKDAHSVATQVLSVTHVSPKAILDLELPSIRVLWAARHVNKLKPGHLAGNRFLIRIRDVDERALEPARAILEILRRRGVPNHFGPQRFGRRGDTYLLGRAILRNDAERFMQRFLGNPLPTENIQVQEARHLFDIGDWPAALNAWPARFNDERRALHSLIARREKTNAMRYAMREVSKRLRTFFVSAYQSYLFNSIVAQRITTLDQLMAGDVATKHEGGASFLVEDPAIEQPRASRFEISPSGPLFGYKTLMAEGQPGKMELDLLEREELTLDQFKAVAGLKLKGARRPLRFPLGDTELCFDQGVVMRFSLPAGCFATNVIAEISKSELAQIDE